ncbi:Os02g0332800, partial [Oryza sativa Japonica Group]
PRRADHLPRPTGAAPTTSVVAAQAIPHPPSPQAAPSRSVTGQAAAPSAERRRVASCRAAGAPALFLPRRRRAISRLPSHGPAPSHRAVADPRPGLPFPTGAAPFLLSPSPTAAQHQAPVAGTPLLSGTREETEAEKESRERCEEKKARNRSG